MNNKTYTDEATGIVARSNGSAAGDRFLAGFAKACQEQADNKRFCTDWLIRHYDVQAMHSDDGWVNRERNYVQLCYPVFNLRPQAGDLIALGHPWGYQDGVRGEYRLVRVTEVKESGALGGMPKYFFEEVKRLKITGPEIDPPPPEPKKTWGWLVSLSQRIFGSI